MHAQVSLKTRVLSIVTGTINLPSTSQKLSSEESKLFQLLKSSLCAGLTAENVVKVEHIASKITIPDNVVYFAQREFHI